MAHDTVDNWAHRSEVMKCRTCMWFVPKAPVAASVQWALGRCRRRAPELGGYPAVYDSDWCGDHKMDETKLEGKLVDAEMRPAFKDFLLHARDLIHDGLTVDGGHHKQYYLEALYRSTNNMLGIPRGTENQDFEKGIAP